MEQNIQELMPFLNGDMQLVALPAKYKKKLNAYYYLATKIEAGKKYTELEINEVLNRWAAFRDPATLRRELYNKRLLGRTEDGEYYWKEEIPSLEEFVKKYL